MQRREHYRIPLNAFCSLQLRKLGNRYMPIGKQFEVVLRNISGGGLCFVSERDIPVSEELIWKFDVNLPEQQLQVYGQLVWKKSTSDQFQYGVKFVFFTDREQRELMSKLYQLQIRSRNQKNMNSDEKPNCRT
ncbi:PilZ domain-containing protein [Effusibacillus lacus]|uniref:PilZ domain-containing protein n=1 Tax=Effusibacillus lacus TaxID=1348429 RepID=A0A292YK50_9BACL|nr:PilZ domain-containing protein [Effusibacillus lacus]TCS68943.1 PilZ domain-containing protein [Effusibacillus lacus]GAX91487.1 hypothetical protein EFBL_3156 [Effusibacillus lacus]